MRTNHLLLMAGDSTARAAADVARNAYTGIVRAAYESPLLPEIEAQDAILRQHRTDTARLSGRIENERRLSLDEATPDDVRTASQETIGRLEGEYLDKVYAAHAVFEEKIRLENELAAMVKPERPTADLQWDLEFLVDAELPFSCLLYTSPSPRDRTRSRMPSSA